MFLLTPLHIQSGKGVGINTVYARGSSRIWLPGRLLLFGVGYSINQRPQERASNCYDPGR